MPDIAAKEFNGGHDLKASLAAGFNKIFHIFLFMNVFRNMMIKTAEAWTDEGGDTVGPGAFD